MFVVNLLGRCKNVLSSYRGNRSKDLPVTEKNNTRNIIFEKILTSLKFKNIAFKNDNFEKKNYSASKYCQGNFDAKF